MMIQPSEARELCSKSEWALVESSFSPTVETFPRSGLKSRLDRARKLYRKTTDLLSAGRKEDEIARTAKSRGRGAALGSMIGRNWTRACAGIHFAAFGFQL